MNKYLMISTAAVLATATGALADDAKKAGSATIAFHSAGGGTYCNEAKLDWHFDSYIGQQILSACNTGSPNGPYEISYSGKAKGGGGLLGFNIAYDNAPSSYNIVLSTPIKNGGSWTLYYCSGITSCFVANDGTYKMADGAPRNPLHLSITAKVSELLKARGTGANQ